MKIRIALAAVAVALGSSTASAQPRWYGVDPYYGPRDYYYVGPGRGMMARVRALGLRPVTQPVRAGRYVVVHALDRSGETKRVVIDPYYGEVVRVTAVTRPDDPPVATPRVYEREVTIIRPRRPLSGWFEDVDRPDVYGAPPRPQARIPTRPDIVRPQAPPSIEAEPLRPRASIPAPDAPEVTGTIPSDILPPPPRIDRIPPRTSEPLRASVNSAATPLPRPRPGELARPSEAPPAAKPAPAQTAAPRVILPGGPAERAERAAASAETRGVDAKLASEANSSAPPSALPPMQALD